MVNGLNLIVFDSIVAFDSLSKILGKSLIDFSKTMKPIVEANQKIMEIISGTLEHLREVLQEFSRYIAEIVRKTSEASQVSSVHALSRVIETPCISHVRVNTPATGPPLIVKANLYIIMLVTWFDTMAMPYLKKAFIAKLISKSFDAFLKYIGMS